MKKTILFLLTFLIFATAAAVEQSVLAGRLTRLHVIANSDTEADQRQKLAVRDALLRKAPALLRESRDPDALLRGFAAAARAELDARGGEDTPVRVTLGPEHYGLRRYGAFALPAGTYRSLRVELGAGAGQNWWCVLFPPLCFATSEEFYATAEEAGLSEEELSLITERDGYVVRFRMVELVERLLDWLRRTA